MARCFIFQADAQKISTQDDCTVPTFKRKKKPPSFTTSESYKLTDEFKIHFELQGFCHEFKRLCSAKTYHQLLPKNKIRWKAWWICAHFVKSCTRNLQSPALKGKMSTNSDLCLLRNRKREIVFILSGARFSGGIKVHWDRPIVMHMGKAPHNPNSKNNLQEESLTFEMV